MTLSSKDRILVTGGNGFIGRSSLHRLKRHPSSILACGRSPRPLWRDETINWQQLDLLERGDRRELIEQFGPSHLLHLAWYTDPGNFWNSSQNLEWTGASIDLLSNFISSGGTHFVGAGSCAEYDWDFAYLSELRTPLNSQTLFGKCKAAFSEIALKYCQEMQIKGSWGRVFYVYGPHERPERLVPGLIAKLKAKQRAPVSAGTQIRDYMYVADVADIFIKMLSSEYSGAVNIGSGRPVQIREIISTIADQLGATDFLLLVK